MIFFRTFALSNLETDFARQAGKISALAKQENFPRQAAKMKSERRHENKILCLTKNYYKLWHWQ